MDISDVSWMFKDQTLMFLCFEEGVFYNWKGPIDFTLPFNIECHLRYVRVSIRVPSFDPGPAQGLYLFKGSFGSGFWVLSFVSGFRLTNNVSIKLNRTEWLLI